MANLSRKFNSITYPSFNRNLTEQVRSTGISEATMAVALGISGIWSTSKYWRNARPQDDRQFYGGSAKHKIMQVGLEVSMEGIMSGQVLLFVPEVQGM